MSVVTLVAAVRHDQVLVERAGDRPGPRLPVAASEDGWVEAVDLRTTLRVGTAEPLAPATRLDGDPPSIVHVLGLPDGEPVDLDGREWLRLRDLDRLAHPAAVAVAVRTRLAERSGRAPWPARRPEWYRAGWLASVQAWVDEQLPAAGLRRTGEAEVVKLWSLSAVVRLPVQGRSTVPGSVAAVYLKAASAHFRGEPAVTRLLASVAPASVPAVLAVDDARGWLLMLPLTGDAATPAAPDTAPEAARTVARLQLQLVDRCAELLAAGAADRRLAATLDALTRLVTDGVELPLLSEDERRDARALLPWLSGELAAFAAAGLPDTLVHGDLHVGNYTAEPTGIRLFDWSDAAVGGGALDAVLLAGSAGPEHEQATLDAYVETWSAARPEDDVAETLRRAPVAHLAYQAVSYDEIVRAVEDQARWELGGVSSRLLRRLVDRWVGAGRPSPGSPSFLRSPIGP